MKCVNTSTTALYEDIFGLLVWDGKTQMENRVNSMPTKTDCSTADNSLGGNEITAVLSNSYFAVQLRHPIFACAIWIGKMGGAAVG